jgi:hypothetical protein
MKDLDYLDKFPRTKKFLDKTGMTLEEAYIWLENELEKRDGEKD